MNRQSKTHTRQHSDQDGELCSRTNNDDTELFVGHVETIVCEGCGDADDVREMKLSEQVSYY